jgi:hypothetical protein
MAAKKPTTRAGGIKTPLGDQMLQIRRLHLDPRNPRHEPLESDAEVIAQLCSEEFVIELVQDIATRGALSPLDVLGVIPFDGHPGHYIAVEGNRRTCALILLSDPSRAPTTVLQAQIRRIASTANVPREVKVHIFADRTAARPWIDLRHLGPQGGIGTREWNAAQKTRAAGGNSKTSSRANTLALAVLDRLVRLGLLVPEQRAKVSLTTITRYLGTPGVRAILGLGSSTELVYTHDTAEVDAALCQLVLDSITPESDGSFAVNSRSSSRHRLGYATGLKSKGIAPATPLPTPAPPPAVTATAAASASAAKKRSGRNPANLPTLFDRSFTVAHRDPILLRLREEALKLSLDDFPFSGNYLLRAFVEQTMILFAKKRGKFSPSMTDEQLSQLCAAELKAMGTTGKALSVINKAAGSAAQPHSLHSLGHAVHGASIPTRQSLRAICDTWQPSLRAMLDAL